MSHILKRFYYYTSLGELSQIKYIRSLISVKTKVKSINKFKYVIII